MSKIEKYKVCKNCGEENLLSLSYCSSCGARLDSDNLEVIEKEVSSEDNSSKKTDKKVGKLYKTANVMIIAVVLLAGGFAILGFSGAFDGLPEVKLGNFSGMTNSDNPHAGSDMNLINQINALEQKVAANPEDHKSILDLAHLLNDSNLNSKAIEKYNVYLEKHPGDADVWVDMGVCYYELKDSKNAIESMTKAIELVPDHQIAHFNLGIVNLSIGNRDKAVDWWNKAIKIDPNSNIGIKAKELLTQH